MWCKLFLFFLIQTRFFYCEDEVAAESSTTTEPIDDKIEDMTEDQNKLVEESAEKFEFQADVDRIMKLIINSLYTNKEIFLRELISNSNDALEKIQFVSLQKPELLDTNPELGVWIKSDPATNTITIRDSGIGMTKEELVKNLGTLAKSGTSDFMKRIQNESSSASELKSLIGQFGVGFYSSFLVADKVRVISKHNSDDQYVWQSDSFQFSISKDPRGNTLGRGTQVVLHLREESSEYLEPTKLNEMITKYSQFIDFKIFLRTKLKEEEKPKSETTSSKSGPDVTVTKTQESPAGETASDDSDKQIGYKLMNEVKPIWMRSPKEVSDEEYAAFYSAITKQTNVTPKLIIHFSAEGETSFRTILFVPPTLPSNFFGNQGEVLPLLKLYIRRVFVAGLTEITIPRYLQFVSGVLDSDDLPLNVGRETLQQSPLNKVIKKRLVRKFLDKLQKLSEEKYLDFYQEFGVCIKMGVMEDNFNQHRLIKLLRFQSSHHSTNMTTLADYITRIKKNQQDIYYIAGSKRHELEKSPMVQKLLRKDYEVIYMVDTVDEYMMQHIQDFESKRFQNVAKDGFRLHKGERATKRHADLEEQFNPLFTWFTAGKYKDHITSARISERTDSSPCLLISDRYGFTGNMHRLIRSQAFSPTSKDETINNRDKRHLELNPKHPMIKEMLRLITEDKGSDQAKELAESCMSIAALSSGYTIDNTLEMASLLESLTVRSLGIEPNTVLDTIQQETDEEIEDDEEDEEDLRKYAPGSKSRAAADSEKTRDSDVDGTTTPPADEESTDVNTSHSEGDSKSNESDDSSKEPKDEL